jgi:hypothetical protein
MHKLLQRFYSEAKLMAVMFLYLWVILGLFVIEESIIAAKQHIDLRLQGVAFINALILAKFMLVLENLDVARGLRNAPLVYPVLVQSILFAIVFICVHFGEALILGAWDGKAISESLPEIGGGGARGVLLVALITSISLVPFFAFRELGRVMGERQLSALFFKGRPKPGSAPQSPRDRAWKADR